MRSSLPTPPEQGQRIDPRYRMQAPNQTIDLGTHSGILRTQTEETAANVSFTLRSLPSPRIVGRTRVSTYIDDDKIRSLELPDLSTRFGVFATKSTFDGAGTELTIVPHRQPIQVRNVRRPRLTSVVFSLMNFYDFLGGTQDILVREGTSLHRLGRVTLRAGGWRITIHALPETSRLKHSLDVDGGYAITHAGLIERARHGHFSGNDASEILETLRLFLSFSRGGFTSYALATGFDGQSEQCAWWGSHIAYPWGSYPGWFSSRPAYILEHTFPYLFQLLRSKRWKNSVRDALYFYLRANNSNAPGIDGGIILAQAALERLTWTYLVEEAKVAVPRRPSERITEMLKGLGLPAEIPRRLQLMKRLAKARSWQNGPRALTEIRNDLVHPNQAFPGIGRVLYEAWKLSQWYVELVILALSGYCGEYTNRINARWIGETERVPWA